LRLAASREERALIALQEGYPILHVTGVPNVPVDREFRPYAPSLGEATHPRC
jgi:hypothetical protein